MFRRNSPTFPLAIAWVCIALSSCSTEAQENPVSGQSTVDPSNATYSGVYDEPVTLKDGYYEGKPFVEGSPIRPRLTLVEGTRVDADLDGDGTPETAVLLTEDSGGSGHFLYIAVLKRVGDDTRNVGTVLVGDRVQIERFYAKGAQLAMDVVQAGPGDAMCCPTQNATRTWAFDGKALKQTSETVTGMKSLADISDIDWEFVGFNQDEPVPDTVRITLRIEGNRVSGKGGCNAYSGELTEGDQPGHLSIGPIGSTKMLCPEPAMSWEKRYLRTLQHAGQFGFVAGELGIGCVVDGEYVSLRFRRSGVTPTG